MTKKQSADDQLIEKLSNKAEAVRRALAKLGDKAMPTEIQGYIKTCFDVEMSTKVISVYKSKLGKQRGKRGRKANVEHPEASVGSLHAISLRDLRTLKALKDRHGHARLRELLELVTP